MSKAEAERERFFQQTMLHDAEQKLNLPGILRTPSVVIDLAVEEFWVTLNNSSLRAAGLQQIRRGSLIPINGDVIAEITQSHAIWHGILYQAGLAEIIPTFINTSPKINLHTIAYLKSSYKTPVVPNIYVHKQNKDEHGVTLNHGGAGVSFVRAVGNDYRNFLPTHTDEFLQPFIQPPIEANGNAYVRDVRVFMVGGEPVAGLVRRARKPLTAKHLCGELVPRLSQVYTARDRGPQEELIEPLRTKAFDRAKTVHQIMVKKALASKRPISPLSPAGFLSIDMLLDANYNLLPVDCDVQPSINPFKGTDVLVGRHLGAHAAALANSDGVERTVVVIGFPQVVYNMFVYEEAKARLGASRVVFQESLMSQTMRFLKT